VKYLNRVKIGLGKLVIAYFERRRRRITKDRSTKTEELMVLSVSLAICKGLKRRIRQSSA